MPTEGECVCNKSYIHLVRVVEVAKRREGLKKQHSVLFFPERDRAHANPQNSTALVSGNPYRRRDKGANI